MDRATFDSQVGLLKGALRADVDLFVNAVADQLFPAPVPTPTPDPVPPPPPPPSPPPPDSTPPPNGVQVIEGFGPKEIPGLVEYHVDSNLDDGSPGTLRHAVSVSGRRVMFDRKPRGDITLGLGLYPKSRIHLDGYSSLEPWTLRQAGKKTSLEGVEYVIVRGMRCDGGNVPDASGNYINQNTGDVWEVNNSRFVTIDHNTLLRSPDGICDCYGSVSFLTVSWNIIALTASASNIGSGTGVKRKLSYHHNLLYLNSERMPRLLGDVSEFDWAENYTHGYESWEHIGGCIYLAYKAGTVNSSGNITGSVYVPIRGRPEKLLLNQGAGQADGPKVFFEDNESPVPLVSTGPRIVIPPEAMVTRYGRSSLKALLSQLAGAPLDTDEDRAIRLEVAG